ncbi:MAG: hypothetical protein Q7R73_00070 [bacterium]|nr:hypothetical protein [bacterium]
MASGITVGGINIKFAALVFLIVVLLLCGVALVIYFSWRVRRLRSSLVTKEIREAQGTVRDGLSELRRDLLDELKLIGSSEKNLSSDELSRKEHILRELDTLEKNMEKEIQDVADKFN